MINQRFLNIITIGMCITTVIIIQSIKAEQKVMDKQIEMINKKLDSIESSFDDIDILIADYKKQTVIDIFNKKIEKIRYYDINTTEAKDVEVYYSVPTDAPTDFYGYMDFRCITDETTMQWKIQQDSWTDTQGLRRYNDDYEIALGSYYSNYLVGERFEIELCNGTIFTAITADIKKDKDTNDTNMYTPVYDGWKLVNANVIEFVVDENVLTRYVKIRGTISGYEEFDSEIYKITKIEGSKEVNSVQ